MRTIDEVKKHCRTVGEGIAAAGWTEASHPLLAGVGLEVAFPQVQDAAEEGDLGFGQPVSGCTKGKMKAEISPRQQRRLLRLPVTPVLPFVSGYYFKNSDFAQGGAA